MKSCNNNSSCESSIYGYGTTNQVSPKALVTFFDGCRYVGMTVQDFGTAFNLGLFEDLSGFAVGDIPMIGAGNELAISGFRFDDELQALVFDGLIIADEFETSTDTFKISERIGLSAYGTQLSINSVFDGTKSIPVYSRYDETGTLGIFQQVIGAETQFPIVTDDSDLLTASSYLPAVTVAGSNVNSIRGYYRFADAGVNVRIKTIAENLEGRTLIVFGTESNPFVEFVTKAYDGTPESETVVDYPGAIASEIGFVYTTLIETFDPETKEPALIPLNMLGTTASGQFRAYLRIDIQTRDEIQLQSGGNVIGSGAAVDNELMVANGPSSTNIKGSGFTVSQILMQSGIIDTVQPALDELDVTVDASDPKNIKLSVAGLSDLYPVFATQDKTLGLADRFAIADPAFSSNDITLTLPEVNAASASKYFLEAYNDLMDSDYQVMIKDDQGATVVSIKPLDRVLVFAVGNLWQFIILSSQFFSDDSISGIGSFSDPAKVEINSVAESATRVFVTPEQSALIGQWPKLYGHKGRGPGTEFTTTSDSFQLVDNWIFSVPTADVYDIITTVQWSLNDINMDAVFRFVVNGVVALEAEQEPKDTSNVLFLTTFGLIDLNQGANTIAFFARKTSNNADVLTVLSNGYTARIVDELS